MFNKKEIGFIIIAIVLSAFIVALHKNINLAIINFLIALVVFTIIIFTNVISKKLAAGYFNIKIEYKLWEFQRFGFKEEQKFSKPFPIGLFFSFIISFLTLGYLESFMFLQFDEENNRQKRLLRKHGLYRKIEMNESDPAFTAAVGFYALLILAILGYILGKVLVSLNIPLDFIFYDLARYSIIYGIWNLIPISKLDGTKLFFGSPFAWCVLVILYAISLFPVLMFL